jgi:hypothetical protein
MKLFAATVSKLSYAGVEGKPQITVIVFSKHSCVLYSRRLERLQITIVWRLRLQTVDGRHRLCIDSEKEKYNNSVINNFIIQYVTIYNVLYPILKRHSVTHQRFRRFCCDIWMLFLNSKHQMLPYMYKCSSRSTAEWIDGLPLTGNCYGYQ